MIELSELFEHIIVIGVAVLLMVLLLFEKIKPAFIFSGAVLIFLLFGIINVDDFLEALSNESILSIFLLIFLTYGIRTNFNILGWMDKVFGTAKKGRGFILRMSTVVAGTSSFLNNTPIVALFLPYVYQWSKRRKISPSKLLIPLSYAAMVGGMITVIGTSTNLVLKGLVEAKGGTPPGVLDYLLPGLLVTAGTILYLVTIGYYLLPNKMELLSTVGKNMREYLVNIKLKEESDLSGKTVQEAGLNMLNGIQLFEIIRNGSKVSPIRGYDRIYIGDTLVFIGNTEKITELFEREDDFEIPYLKEKEDDKSNSKKPEKTKKKENSEKENEDDITSKRSIIETVIPANSTLTGRTLKSLNFNRRYDAVVIGIHRNGVELTQKIGLIPLMPGDLLLMVPGKDFRRLKTQEDDFYIVSIVKNISTVSKKVRFGFLGILLAVVLGMGFLNLSLFLGLLILLSYMVAGKMLSIQDLKEQFGVNLFVVLVGSLAFSTALINSGVAEMAANTFMGIFQDLGSKGILIGIFVATLILTSFVTHVAAVAIIFPIAFAIGSQVSGIDLTAIFIAIAFAASASFHTPFSYQTNMMVYGPGGYKFSDFLKVGLPLTVLYSILAIGFILFYYEVG